MWRYLVVMTLLTTPAGEAAEDFIEVLTPPNQISVTTDVIHIVGRTSAPEVTMILNNHAPRTWPVKDSVFHIHLRYGYGFNEIEISPSNGDPYRTGRESVSLEIVYGPRISRQIQKIFPGYVFHDATTQEACIGCHAQGTHDLTAVADDAACIVCHNDMADQFSKHTEVDDRTCINCHELDPLVAGGMAGNTAQNPCYRCHADKIIEYSQEFIHGPVAAGGCVVCHNPHGSPYEKNLHSSQQILCFSCHEDMEDELDKEFVHQPYEDGRCSACHDPHATGYKWQLVKTSEDVCMSCHEELGTLQLHRHPFNVAPKKPLRVDLELTERGTLECVSCHDPHSSNSAHLLKLSGRFNCVACHDDKQ